MSFKSQTSSHTFFLNNFFQKSPFNMISLLVTILALSVWFIYLRVRRDPKGPPGPPRLPILGNLHQMAQAHPYGYRAYHELSKKYGDIMSVKVGFQEMVVLSSFDVMRDLLAKEEMSGRLWNGFLVDRSMGQELGVAFASGQKQELLKTFVIKALGEFGFGKQAFMESTVLSELEAVKSRFRTLSKINGGVVLMKRHFQLSLLNVLWGMMAGIRYDYDDPKLARIIAASSAWFETGNFGAGIVTAYPFLRFLFKEWTGYYVQEQGNEVVHTFLRELVDEHRKQDSYKLEPQCFIDAFLKEIDKNKGNENTYFTDEEFMITCYDMFQAGFETTSNTMAFAVLLMLRNPKVQKKVQAELDEVFPAGQSPLLEDKDKLPYTRATVLEVFRMSNILPISGPRKIMEDFTYRGYQLKKDTAVTFNTYSAMRDVKVWGDPDNFRPERFLTEDGKGLNGLEKYIYIAFGHGRRRCMGETLAQTTVWMYFTTLMHHFSFEQVPGQPLPTMDPIFSIILSPTPYNVLVKCRK